MADIYSEDRVRTIVSEELTDTFVDQHFRKIVREEIAGSPHINAMQKDISELKSGVHHLGVLFEDMDSKLDTVLEASIDAAKIMNRLDGHEGRIIAVEKAQKLLTKTVTAHSRQLKTT